MPASDDHEKKRGLIRREVDVCKRLASNDLKVRRKGLSILKKLFNDAQYESSAEDFERIWNGLFYYVWMSDKPLVQEHDVEAVSHLIHEIQSYELVMLFIGGFYQTIARHWDRISHFRRDKFLMFIRRFLRQSLILLKNTEWDVEKVELFSAEIYSALQILPLGLALHLNEIYNEEVAKITAGKIPTRVLMSLLKCYVECIVNLKPSMQVVNSISVNIFSGLVKQLKLYVQQKAVMDLASDEFSDTENQPIEDGDEDAVYDPRPGNVNVYLPYVEFDENAMAGYLESYAAALQTPRKAKNILTQIIGMLRSVTKLRKAVVESADKILAEPGEQKNRRKRKKAKTETMSSLIRKSCKKLEEEQPIRAFKKLGRIQQLISSVSSPTVNTWTVTEHRDSEPTVTPNNTSQDWTITDLLDDKQSPLTGTDNLTTTAVTATTATALPEDVPESEDANDASTNQLKSMQVDHSTRVAAAAAVAANSMSKRISQRKSQVSFLTDPAVRVSYEAEPECSSEWSAHAECVVVVPSSAVTERPGLLKENGNYNVVDFRSSRDGGRVSVNQDGTTKKRNAKPQDSDAVAVNLDTDDLSELSEPAWKISRETMPSRTVEESAVESDTDYDISGLFGTPPKKRGRKSMRNSMVVQEVKRSQRIADKAAAAAKLSSGKN